MNIQIRNRWRFVVVATVAAVLSACDSGGVSIPPPPPPPPAPPMANFTVTVVNLTNAQPLSPIAIIGHLSGYSVFSVGSAARPGLEELAEGGDNSSFVAEALANSAVLDAASGAAPIGPGGSDMASIGILDSDRPELRISVATMLVNTNDAFSGLNSVAVGDMAVGDVMAFNSIAYDAGTEADTEMAIHIPGPAGGGEGFNSLRDDDADRVSMHSGVVSQDDGLASSDLTEQHRFDNPAIRIRIERTL